MVPKCMFCRQFVPDHLSTCRAARASALARRQQDGREAERVAARVGTPRSWLDNLRG